MHEITFSTDDKPKLLSQVVCVTFSSAKFYLYMIIKFLLFVSSEYHAVISRVAFLKAILFQPKTCSFTLISVS